MNDTPRDRVSPACPDWRRLAAARDTSPAEPAGWEEALAHLDGCAACRRSAVEADPTLAFRRLSPVAVGGEEVEAMRLRVAALRGASGVARPATRRLLPRRLAGWQPVAAAAALAMAVLAGDHAPGGPRAAVVPIPALRAAERTVLPPSLGAQLSAQPLLEELDQPYEHVVQWNADDLSVVLVVDERLDV
jgi:hypothetical protein